MNTAILVSSFKYLNKFELVILVSRWVYSELSRVKYSDIKLIRSFEEENYDFAESILNNINNIEQMIIFIVLLMKGTAEESRCFTNMVHVCQLKH